MSPALGGNTILTPQTAQDAAKIAPRSSQDGLKSDLKRDRFSMRFWDRFWVVLSSVLVSQGSAFGHPFGHHNRSKNLSKIELLKKSLQDRPPAAQGRPRPDQGHGRSSTQGMARDRVWPRQGPWPRPWPCPFQVLIFMSFYRG